MKYFRIFYLPIYLYFFHIMLIIFTSFFYVVQFKKEINQRKYKIYRLLKKV